MHTILGGGYIQQEMRRLPHQDDRGERESDHLQGRHYPLSRSGGQSHAHLYQQVGAAEQLLGELSSENQRNFQNFAQLQSRLGQLHTKGNGIAFQQKRLLRHCSQLKKKGCRLNQGITAVAGQLEQLQKDAHHSSEQASQLAARNETLKGEIEHLEQKVSRQHEISQQLLDKVEEQLQAKQIKEIKDSIDPVRYVATVIAFIVGGIFSGAFSVACIGAGAIYLLSEVLKKYRSRQFDKELEKELEKMREITNCPSKGQLLVDRSTCLSQMASQYRWSYPWENLRWR